MPRTLLIGDLVEDLLPMLGRTLGAAYPISIDIAPDVWPVLVDPGQLESALLNLVLNARDAMSNGGHITIAARNTTAKDLGQKYERTLGGRDFVALSVTDAGSGMSKEILDKAIDPFFTTKAVGEGSGLGLSMVFGFVMQSGGHFELESAPREGTTATIFLPRSHEPEAAKTGGLQETSIAEGGSTVLIVEDDPDVCALASRCVTGLGYRVLTAPDVASARSAMREDGGIDLVLTDVVLPGGESGIDLAIELRLAHPDLSVVFMSGYPRDELELGDLDGADMIMLAKPFRRSHLAAALRSKLEKSNSS